VLDVPRLRSDFFAFLAARFSLRDLPGFFVCPEGGALDPMGEAYDGRVVCGSTVPPAAERRGRTSARDR
jgi:hypothetical protein